MTGQETFTKESFILQEHIEPFCLEMEIDNRGMYQKCLSHSFVSSKNIYNMFFCVLLHI